jgi:hypothetical protein
MVAAGFAALALPPLKPDELHPHKSNFFSNVWPEFLEGVKTLLSSKNLHYPFIALIAIQVYNGMLITIAPAFVNDVLQLNLEQGTVFMIAPLATGILFGSLLLGIEGLYMTKKGMVRLGFTGLGVTTIVLAVLVGPDNHWLYALLAFILGLFTTYIFAPSHSMLQTEADERLRGRIYASLFLLLQLAATMPTVIVGALADSTSVAEILGGIGLVLLVFSIFLRTIDKKFAAGKI